MRDSKRDTDFLFSPQMFPLVHRFLPPALYLGSLSRLWSLPFKWFQPHQSIDCLPRYHLHVEWIFSRESEVLAVNQMSKMVPAPEEPSLCIPPLFCSSAATLSLLSVPKTCQADSHLKSFILVLRYFLQLEILFPSHLHVACSCHHPGFSSQGWEKVFPEQSRTARHTAVSPSWFSLAHLPCLQSSWFYCLAPPL